MARPLRLTVLSSLLLLCSVMAAYAPAWNGDFLWDDDAHISQNAALTDIHGLINIWVKPGSVQQYYPATYTVFWIQRQLWGLNTRGYHLVNILLHGLNALLLALLLTELGLSGAWMAAWLFALHPVCVESVAWMSELKNVLSTFFALSASIAFIKSTRADARAYWYGTSILLFGFALLSKSVTATLPAAALFIQAWMRGPFRLSWMKLLAPHLGLAIGIGLFTLHIEHSVIGAATRVQDLSYAQHGILAGKAILFYLGKLMVPSSLLFMYPKWALSTADLREYLYPAAVLLISVGLYAGHRRWGKRPLAFWIYFVSCLMPALGWTKIYPMRFSYVADHFQYLASLGVFAAVGWLITGLTTRYVPNWRPMVNGGIVGLLAIPLAFATARQSRLYASSETLWEHTLAGNPGSAIAHHQVGILYSQKSMLREAVTHLRMAAALDPTFPQTHLALAYLARMAGRLDIAIREYEKAFELGVHDSDIVKDYQALLRSSSPI